MDKAIEIIENKITHLESVLVENKPYWLVIGILKDLIREINEKK
jgi:hypothetical protein